MARLASKAGQDIEVQSGKRVEEIKPAGIDRGTTVGEYLNEPPFHLRRPVFIGDDLLSSRQLRRQAMMQNPCRFSVFDIKRVVQLGDL